MTDEAIAQTSNSCNCANGSYGQKHTTECFAAQIARLRGALLDLYNGTAEYIYLTTWVIPRSLGAKNMLHRPTDETRARQTYMVTGRFLPLSENGVLQVGLADVIHETTHEVVICDVGELKAAESHYCIDCNEAHDPRTCGALPPDWRDQKSTEPEPAKEAPKPGARCIVTYRGKRCCKPDGHDGEHVATGASTNMRW